MGRRRDCRLIRSGPSVAQMRQRVKSIVCNGIHFRPAPPTTASSARREGPAPTPPGEIRRRNRRRNPGDSSGGKVKENPGDADLPVVMSDECQRVTKMHPEPDALDLNGGNIPGDRERPEGEPGRRVGHLDGLIHLRDESLARVPFLSTLTMPDDAAFPCMAARSFSGSLRHMPSTYIFTTSAIAAQVRESGNTGPPDFRHRALAAFGRCRGRAPNPRVRTCNIRR